jgi:type I restriction enzyme M protein
VFAQPEKHIKAILDWAEKEELNLNAKQKTALGKKETWQKQLDLMATAHKLMEQIGSEEHSNFNVFRDKVDKALKVLKVKLSATEKNQILNAVSWYDATAEKVEKARYDLAGKDLQEWLDYLGCTKESLPDFGLYPTGEPDEYVEYETESDLRDTENVPLKESIHTYFLREVKPHADEAWINMEATKIGYEISFNKYFYRHKPLRSIKEVTAEILQLEADSDGLIREILQLG